MRFSIICSMQHIQCAASRHLPAKKVRGQIPNSILYYEYSILNFSIWKIDKSPHLNTIHLRILSVVVFGVHKTEHPTYQQEFYLLHR